MKVQITVTDQGMTFHGEAVLKEVKLGGLPNPTPIKTDVGKPRAPRPSEAVQKLYAKGFFGTGRVLADVLKQLESDGFNFSSPSILMALKAAGFLRRNGAKGTYRFVQKYPPIAA
jgi:hypothetical protein